MGRNLPDCAIQFKDLREPQGPLKVKPAEIFCCETRGSLLKRYLRFCVVGGTGVAVDMAILWWLASPGCWGWNLSVSKAIAAEAAIVNNFLWNDQWTFRDLGAARSAWRERLGRLAKFNLICAAGIGLSVLLLNVLVYRLHLNLAVANLASIAVVSIWNFFMNLQFGWNTGGSRPPGVADPTRSTDEHRP